MRPARLDFTFTRMARCLSNRFCETLTKRRVIFGAGLRPAAEADAGTRSSAQSSTPTIPRTPMVGKLPAWRVRARRLGAPAGLEHSHKGEPGRCESILWCPSTTQWTLVSERGAAADPGWLLRRNGAPCPQRFAIPRRNGSRFFTKSFFGAAEFGSLCA